MSAQAAIGQRTPSTLHPQAPQTPRAHATTSSVGHIDPAGDVLVQHAARSASPSQAATRVQPGLPSTCLARPKALLPGVTVERRNDTTGSHTVSLWRTTNVAEKPAKSDPTLRVVDATQLFQPGTVFFGFGKPNVYLGRVGDANAGKVDAKSLCREPTQIALTRGNVQSGLFIVPRDLPADAASTVIDAAHGAEGSRDITCVRINTRILAEAGFTLNGCSIKYTWPTDLLNALFNGRVEYKGKRVHFDIIRTTPQPLSQFMSDVSWAVKTTPYRHAPASIKWMLAPVCGPLATVVDRVPVPSSEKPLLAEPAESAAQNPGPEHAMYFSVPSRLGGLMRQVWGPHPIVTLLNPQGVALDSYLPQPLKAFDIAKPSLVTRLKRDVIFCSPVQSLLRHGLAKFNTETESLREENVPGMINANEKYNLVVTAESIKFMSIAGNSKAADWLLSKHVLVAGNNADVRFAGELWKTDDDVIHINRNSGTYRPSSEQLSGAMLLAADVFPTLKFQKEDL